MQPFTFLPTALLLLLNFASYARAFLPRSLVSLSSSLRPRQHTPLSMAYCLNVKITVNPSMRAAFIQAIEANAKGTRTNEKGNINYSWGESTTVPNTWHFQEQFVDEAAFLEHTRAPHFKVWETFAATPGALVGSPVVEFFTTL